MLQWDKSAICVSPCDNTCQAVEWVCIWLGMRAHGTRWRPRPVRAVKRYARWAGWSAGSAREAAAASRRATPMRLLSGSIGFGTRSPPLRSHRGNWTSLKRETPTSRAHPGATPHTLTHVLDGNAPRWVRCQFRVCFMSNVSIVNEGHAQDGSLNNTREDTNMRARHTRTVEHWAVCLKWIHDWEARAISKLCPSMQKKENKSDCKKGIVIFNMTIFS